ncbi:IS5 family transposase [Streptomyces sp. NPDC057027]|uniref:IS5 family transposase n=1 Tax=Streptomyces sp. NPDC057027 TaxID=3346004 RepID=UPI00363D5CA6
MSLADAQWARIEPLLPDRTPKRGGSWRDHRQVIDAIAFKYRAGTPWMDLPEYFDSWKGAHNRLRKWAVGGTWERVFTALLAQADAEGDLDWIASVDSTIVRAHQHAAGARQKGPRPTSRSIMPSDGLAAADHEDPSCCGQPLSAARFRLHSRPGWRRTRVP